jgi:ketosteroid isomerase-like protein
MSEQNVETFKRGAEAWNRDDFEAWIDCLDPEIEWFTVMEVYRGHAGARDLWESLKGDVELKVRFDEVRDLGEVVLGLGEMTGVGHATRLSVANPLGQLATFRDGKVIKFRDFPSHPETLEAAGLSE